MAYDNEALEAKRKEIISIAQGAISPSLATATQTAESAVKSFITLTPPTKPEEVIGIITMRFSGRGGARSRKPGNIYLNWRKLIDAVPDVTIAAIGGTTSPTWMLPLVGLYIWNKLWRNAEEDLSEAEATIIYVLWKNRDNQNKISENDGFVRTNEHRKEMSLHALSRKEFDVAINHLLRIECIEIKEGIIWLREWGPHQLLIGREQFIANKCAAVRLKDLADRPGRHWGNRELQSTSRAEQSAAADCFQRPLLRRSRLRQRLSASVRRPDTEPGFTA